MCGVCGSSSGAVVAGRWQVKVWGRQGGRWCAVCETKNCGRCAGSGGWCGGGGEVVCVAHMLEGYHTAGHKVCGCG